MAAYKTYEEYKDSGISWVGGIPIDWSTTKIKFNATLNGRIGWQGLTSAEYCDEGVYLITGVNFSNGAIDWDSCVHVPMSRWIEAEQIQIKENDLLITKDGTVGKVAIVKNLPGETSLNSGVLLIRLFEETYKRYLFWVLQSPVFTKWFSDINLGNSTILHLYQKDFFNFVYPLPTAHDAIAIAAYLDEKVGQIDSIIAEAKASIDEYKNWKASIIYEAVTKGLDKKRNLVASNNMWLGKVPAEWRVQKCKTIMTFINGFSFDSADLVVNPQYPVIRIGNINNCNIDLSSAIGINNNTGLDSYKIQKNDILLAMSGATAGKVAYINNSDVAYINQRVGIIRSKFSKFLFYSLLSPNFIRYVMLMASGTAQPNISTKMMEAYEIALPSENEMLKITEYLDDKTSQIDSLISEKESLVADLEAYKKSLIYEVVTGKRKVV